MGSSPASLISNPSQGNQVSSSNILINSAVPVSCSHFCEQLSRETVHSTTSPCSSALFSPRACHAKRCTSASRRLRAPSSSASTNALLKRSQKECSKDSSRHGSNAFLFPHSHQLSGSWVHAALRSHPESLGARVGPQSSRIRRYLSGKSSCR